MFSKRYTPDDLDELYHAVDRTLTQTHNDLSAEERLKALHTVGDGVEDLDMHCCLNWELNIGLGEIDVGSDDRAPNVLAHVRAGFPLPPNARGYAGARFGYIVSPEREKSDDWRHALNAFWNAHVLWKKHGSFHTLETA